MEAAVAGSAEQNQPARRPCRCSNSVNLEQRIVRAVTYQTSSAQSRAAGLPPLHQMPDWREFSCALLDHPRSQSAESPTPRSLISASVPSQSLADAPAMRAFIADARPARAVIR